MPKGYMKDSESLAQLSHSIMAVTHHHGDMDHESSNTGAGYD